MASETTDAKWWHVPDEQIEELVREMANNSGEATCTEDRPKRRTRTTLMLLPSITAAGWATGKSSSKVRPKDGLEEISRRMPPTSKYLKDRAQEGQVPDVDFHEEDSGRTVGRSKKWWKVTDDELEDHIRQLCDQEEEMHPSDPEQTGTDTSPNGRRIHVRLNWLARSEPIPCKRTGRRHSAAPQSDILIPVYFHVVDTGFRFSLDLHPNMRIGPDQPPTANRFTERYGLGASTKGFAEKANSYDYKYRNWISNARPDWVPRWTDNLKGQIELATGLEVSKQRILCHGSIIGDDCQPLRACGVTPGTQLQVFTTKEPSAGQRNVTLATSLKRQELDESRRVLEETKQRSEALARNAKAVLKAANAAKGFSPPKQCAMPPMVFQESPNLFGAVAKGNAIKRVSSFAELPIYRPAGDTQDRKLERIRSLPLYINPVAHR